MTRESAGTKAARQLLAKMEAEEKEAAASDTAAGNSSDFKQSLAGGISAAVPKDVSKKARKEKKVPEEESDGVKAARKLLAKMETEEKEEAEGAVTSEAVSDALSKGLAAASKVTTKDKIQAKADQEMALADNAKAWLEGKSEEEKKAMITKAVKGGLGSSFRVQKTKPKPKKEKEPVDGLPSNVEFWLEKIKAEKEEEEDLGEIVKAALRGGAASAAAAPKKEKTDVKVKEYVIPDGVKIWIEANTNTTKWEEEAGETMTAAMYGGGISAMIAAKNKPKVAPKQEVADEDLVPKSIQKWLKQQEEKEEDDPDAWQDELNLSRHVPDSVKAFIAEAKKGHSDNEVTAALNQAIET